MAIMNSHLGELPVGAQVGLRVTSTALNFVPVVGPVLSGIVSLFSSIFGGMFGAPTRHQKSDAAIEAAKKYYPRDLPDLIRRVERFIVASGNTSIMGCGGMDFGGGNQTGQEGRAQYVAACQTAKKLGFTGMEYCPPYDDQWCPHLKSLHDFYVKILPSLKTGNIPGATPVQVATIQNIATTVPTPLALANITGGISNNLVPLILIGGGVYLFTRK
jgi:hypothetical protein